MLRKALGLFLINKLLVFIVLLGTTVWSSTMIRSGISYPFGIGFWGPNGHDGIWHIALANNLAKGLLENPVFADENIKNYHIGFDLLLAILHKVTTIPVSVLYFQTLPPIFAILIGILTYWFVIKWRNSQLEALWATVFVYFSGGLGFIITYLKDGVITGESMFWSQQSVSTLINPPFVLSLIFILSGLIALQKKNILLGILFFGVLIQIKAYAAILVLGGLFVSTIYSYILHHTSDILKVFMGSLVLNLLLFSLIKNDGISTFVWQPMWFLETMMSYSDRLGWERFYSAMTTYKMGHIWIKGFIAYFVAFVIFLLGNMGLRVVGFYFLCKSKIDNILIFLVVLVLMAITIPMFFVQKGTPWNTIQFFYYYLFFFSIFAGIATSWIKSNVKYLAFFIFAIFGAWSTLQHYLPKMPQSFISKDEIEALDFLSNQSDGIIFSYPFDIYKATEAVKNPPRPLYFYDSTSYVSAFSEKQSFEEDEVNLNIMGYDWKSRREETLSFVSNLDVYKGRKFLDSNDIKYLYLVKENSPLQGELLKLGSTELGLSKIFENKGYIIYEYGKDFGSN
ncbi:MAG: hypothetical protein ACD_26C00034G0091 [uncultured bacterium]|nr:MAG: hypothetical protein ACD_26C00034G0091 [uncultured bacterium]